MALRSSRPSAFDDARPNTCPVHRWPSGGAYLPPRTASRLRRVESSRTSASFDVAYIIALAALRCWKREGSALCSG